jgi:membrane protein insertase Oxa1/YidC/SpoIIIJ
MLWVTAIWLALLGVLAAPNLILSKKPNAKEYLDKLAPYQGWIGVVSAFWGIWGIISFLRMMSWYIKVWPIMGFTYLAVSIVLLLLGFMLGLAVIKGFVKNESAQAKMDSMREKLAPKQGLLGIVAIGLGVWMIIANLIFKPSYVGAAENLMKGLQNLMGQ